MRMKSARLLVPLLLLPMTAVRSETVVNGRSAMVLESDTVRLTVDLAGGSIAGFQFREQGLNPLQWEEPGPKTAPRPMGHFLCLDRWGAASAAEEKNGMPFHGEAAGDPVNVSNGNMFYQAQDVLLPASGMPLQIVRTYNSQVSEAGPFGIGWTHSYDMAVRLQGTSLIYRNATGRSELLRAAGAECQRENLIDSLLTNYCLPLLAVRCILC